jgi:tRNA pseudouridine55 synthase
VGNFSDQNAIEIADLEAVEQPERDQFLRPLNDALTALDEITLDDRQAQLVRMGNPALLLGRNAPIAIDLAYATHKGNVVAIGYVEKGQFKPSRVIVAS